MLTPFKENGAIDFEGLTALTEFYMEAGAAGLFANCLSSEMFELTPAERLDLVGHILNVTQNKIPVVATGTFGGAIEEQAEFVKKMYDKGVDAVIVISGLLAAEKDSDAFFDDQVFRLLELTEKIPLGFYECPVPYKRVLSADQLGRYVDTGRIIYHKDTCLNLESVRAKNKAGLVNPNFGLYDAYMVHAVDSLKSGSAGLSCIQGNFFPELISWLCKNYETAGLEDEVAKVQQFFINEMDVMHAVYPIIAKYYLQKRGLNISTFTRKDESGIFTQEIRNRIDALGDRYALLKDHISIGALS